MKDYGTMILRVALGAIYLGQAYLALFVATPQGTAGFLAKSAGLPWPTVLALAVIVLHGVGGAMLVLGLWTRLIAAANAVLMVGGLLAVYVRQGSVLKGALLDAATGRAAPAGYEYILLLVAATVAIASLGPGAWSLGR